MTIQRLGVVLKTEKQYVQRLSKVSEWFVKQTIRKMYSLCLCASVVKTDSVQNKGDWCPEC